MKRLINTALLAVCGILCLCAASCGMTGGNLPNIRTPYGETSGTEVILYPLPDIEIGNPPAREY